MKKHIPTNESGRSMVEMLGVLAIMGVLSIGAVAGYRWAMDKYAANDTIRELSLRAVTYAQQMQVGASALSSTEFHPENETRQGYPLTADVVDEDFQISLSQVPENVCAHILNMGWHLPFRTQVNDVVDGDADICQEGENTLAFSFHSDLSGGEFVEISDQPSEPESTDVLDPEETIETDPFESTEVVSSAGFPESSEIVSSGYMMCQPGEFLGYGSCLSCSHPYGASATAAECAQCDDTDTPRFMSTDGDCYPCSASYGVSATAAECAQCDDSGTPRVLLENGRCALESCGTNQFLSTFGDCYSCSTSTSVSATAAECAKCGDSGTPRFWSTDGFCRSCSLSGGFSATEAECAKCDASSTPRYMDGRWCFKCPTSLVGLNPQEKCQSCHGTWNAGTQTCS